jgi:hypothetical protein
MLLSGTLTQPKQEHYTKLPSKATETTTRKEYQTRRTTTTSPSIESPPTRRILTMAANHSTISRSPSTASSASARTSTSSASSRRTHLQASKASSIKRLSISRFFSFGRSKDELSSPAFDFNASYPYCTNENRNGPI